MAKKASAETHRKTVNTKREYEAAQKADLYFDLDRVREQAVKASTQAFNRHVDEFRKRLS